MNLETLTNLGLTEEVAQQVLDAHKESFKGFIPKERFDAVNDKKKQLEADVQERDSQLEGLKSVNAEELQEQIAKLQADNKASAESYEAKLQEQAYTFALKEALSGAKVRNHKAVEALLNKENIKLEGDKLDGLTEQLEVLKESDSYLFNVEEAPKQENLVDQAPKFTVGSHTNTSGSGDVFTQALFNK